MPQLDACLRKSKGSGTALARLLVNVYFDDETLAHSSVRGTKSKPALDSKIINAIISKHDFCASIILLVFLHVRLIINLFFIKVKVHIFLKLHKWFDSLFIREMNSFLFLNCVHAN